MSILGKFGIGAIGTAVDSVSGLISGIRGLFTGKETLSSADAGKIEQYLSQLESEVIALKSKIVDSQQNIIITEAQGDSWLQRNWRPLTMMTFLFIIVYQGVLVSIFNLPPVDFSTIPEQMWNLLKIGLGGYIVGRTVEKSVKSWRAEK